MVWKKETRSQDSGLRIQGKKDEAGDDLNFQLFAHYLKFFVRMFDILNNIVIAPASYLLY